jgi:diguanylate cyclase (GGDEF)-like protein/PAS domain S-box-containing protein
VNSALSAPGTDAPYDVATEGSLEEEYEALLQFLYLAPVGLLQMRADGDVVMINPLCAQLLMPLSRTGGLSNLFQVLQNVAPDLSLRVSEFAPLHGKVCDALHLQIDSGLPGRRDPQVLSLTLLKLDAERLMAVIDDVSASVKRDRDLRLSQAWIHTIVTGITDYALLALDRDGAIQSWNPGMRQVTGFEAEDAVGRPYSIIFPDDDRLRHRVTERLREADLSGWNLEEGWMRRANGEKFWGSCLIAPLHPPVNLSSEPVAPADCDDDRAYSLIVRDISDQREANEALRRSVFSDHLTGLVNRRAFYESAAVAMERSAHSGQPLSVIVFDADHFKAVNDTYGHAAGDAVLRHLAAGLSANFRSNDIVARFGGEEFIVLMPGLTEDEALTMAQRMCQHVSATALTVDGVTISYTVSAGVAGLAPDIDGIDQLLKRADDAMYRAKAEGRNRVARWRAEAHGTRS